VHEARAGGDTLITMARGTNHLTTPLVLVLPIAAVAALAPSPATAATPTYYNNLAAFQSDVTFTVTDDYQNPAYVFIQSNAVMSAVLGQTDYVTTGFGDLNIVSGGVYCAGCNGSFELSFQTTTVGTAAGVNGVGMSIVFQDPGLPYFAFITFADGTTANIQLPAAGSFWGVAAPERIQRIHFGLSMGGVTQNGSFGIDNLIIGDGNIGTCVVSSDCVDDGNPCTNQVCNAGLCTYPFNVATCDDGEVCTENDVCSLGVCQGALVDCADGNPCTTNFCDFGVGCAVIDNSDPCDDGNVCTENDACAAGSCAGSPIRCSDDDVCTIDSCDPMVGCASEVVEGCCQGDEDCAAGEACNLSVNACEPAAGSTGASSAGSSDGGEAGSTGTPGQDDTAGESGGGTGAGTGGVGTGTGGSTGDGTGAGFEGGDPPTPDFSVCSCSSTPPPEGRWLWLWAGVGALVRRRRRKAA
jgi:MYXO-CTERM domain-containing protein